MSWISFINTAYVADNVTCVYIPKEHITTGYGDAIKIFDDNYAINQDYGDLGTYFYDTKQELREAIEH